MRFESPTCASIALLAVSLQAAPITQGPTEWTVCPSNLPSALRCTIITVPLDHEDPECEETLDLTLVKLPARNSGARKGSLIWQYGGPGEDTTKKALVPAAESEQLTLGDVQLYFDIITADPRGVGMNHPVTCDPLGDETFSYFPKTEEEYTNTLSQFEVFGKSCINQTGNVIHFMDTLTQARDLEIARLAIGEGPLNYYGLSWGTIRGFEYAAHYPDNVGLMTLDGVVDHSSSHTALSTSQAHSMSLVMRRMLDWMRENSTSVLYEQDTVKMWRELIERADRDPLPAPECAMSGACLSEITSDVIRTSIFEELSHPNVLWPEGAIKIQQAYENNNGTSFSYPTSQDRTGLMQSQLSIACQDWHFEESWDEFKLFQYMTGIYSLDPTGPFGGRIWSIGCPRWPVHVRNPPRTLYVDNESSSKPILLVHALLDPNTGYDQALGVHRKIGRSILLSRYGEGHGSLEWPEGSQAIMDYFVNGTVPGPTTLADRPMNADTVTDFEVMGIYQ